MLLWNWPRTCWNYFGARARTQPPGRSSMRVFLPTLVCGLLAAQQTVRPPQTQQPPPVESTGLTIPITVEHVQAPVTVFDREGGYVNNVRPEQFHLFDNDQEQNIKVDVTYTPISLAILIQSSAHVEGLLPQVNKIGRSEEHTSELQSPCNLVCPL